MANYEPFDVQRAAHKAFLIDGYKRGLLYWSRRCFAAGTLVKTVSGVEVPIENMRPGMWVVSYNEELGVIESKEVLELHSYGASQDPKPMIEWKVNGQTITSTYDHQYYVNGIWQPVWKLAWGAMAPVQREQLRLLCKQYGQNLEPIYTSPYETRFRRFWVFKDGDVQQNNQNSSSSWTDLVTKSSQQTPNKSYRQREDEQSNRESRVGNKSREHGSHDEAGSTNQKSWREVRDTYTHSPTGVGDIILSKMLSPYEQTGDEQAFSENISSLFRINTPYFEGQDLEISEVRVRESQPTYDLTVADNHNYVVHNLLVHNTGKTLWSVQQLMWSCMLNQGPHHIVFKEYQQAETVAWNQYLHLIPQQLIKSTDKTLLTVTFNYFSGTIKMPNGEVKEIVSDTSKPSSSLRLLGSDKADAHRGGESNGMIFDEYQDQDSYGWDFVYQPMLLTTDGWACFMGTAKDRDEWNELLDKAEHNDSWYYSRATWRDNPRVKPEVIARLRKEAEQEGKLGPFLQEHELIPFTQQGAVYPMFEKKIHVVTVDEVPQEGTDYVALDFGWTEGHPLAACFVRITRDDIWYQWDEIHGTGIQLDDAIAEIKVKMGDRKLTAIIADSARPDLIDYMASKGLPMVPSPKKQNSIISGIDLLRKRLKPKIQIIGDPKPNYYISNNCKKTIYDWTHYRYREVKQDRHPTELPEKKFDDSLDALRYLELFFKFGHPKDEKMPENSMMKSLNPYGLL